MDFKKSEYSNYIHLQPHSDYIKYGGNIAVDFLGKFETLDEDFKVIERELKLPNLDLMKIRSSSIVSHEPKFYDEEMRRIVADIYREDFERFEYVK